MDLQLYRVDDQNYLVDFRNFGYYPVADTGSTNGAAAPSDDVAASVPPSVPVSIPGSAPIPSPVPASLLSAGSVSTGASPSPHGHAPGKPMEFGHGVSGPFHFLEMACQLIAELASG